MFIYMITNTVNGKCYIGKTTNTPDFRWKQHQANSRYSDKLHFHRAIRKYGAESFIIEVLEEISGDLSDLNEAEIKWISIYSPQYNMTSGGDGGWIYDQTGNTWKVSEVGRENMRKSRQLNKESYTEAREMLIQKISGANNYQSVYEITTPWGLFYTWTDAINEAKRLRKSGRKDVVTDRETLRKYCEHNTLLHAEGRRTYAPWRGKYTRDLGFDIQPKKDN